MEVKINKEIRDYAESVFFGLSMRQLVFSVAAVGVAVLLYFLLKPRFGIETVSWVCILGAAPFAAMGFFRYHGMTAEEFIVVWLRSELLEPKTYTFRPKNLYKELMDSKSESRGNGNETKRPHIVVFQEKDKAIKPLKQSVRKATKRGPKGPHHHITKKEEQDV